MMNQWIEIKAGSKAYHRIQQQGLTSEDIGFLFGASGGPKWFILQGLDDYLFGDFFNKRTQPLKLVGTSAGAWRFASLGQAQPAKASALFSHLYRSTVYSEKADTKEITDKAKALLDEYVNEQAIQEILSQNVFQHYILVARSKGLTASHNRGLQALGLLTAALTNKISRNNLSAFFERVVFHHPFAAGHVGIQWGTVQTKQVALNTENFRQALLATGSIPMVLEGVQDIPGAPKGMYRDGGITDYHFDFDVSAIEDLILYPHFQSEVIPGWFDKRSKRRTTGQHWDNVILIHPSQAFISRLPYQKIPDRKDFETMNPAQRQAYWQEATDLGYKMAAQLKRWIETGEITQRIKLWS